MKSLLAILFVLLMMNSSTAYAAKARAIDDEMDSIFHANHMKRHIGETICHATGNYIKTRSQENKNKVIGHLEQADVFELLAIEDGYALIRVITSHKTSPDSWVGMTGWVNPDYIDCMCPQSEYQNVILSETKKNSTGKFEEYVGTTFLKATVNKLRIRNKPDGKTILGRIGKEDEFILLAVEDGWAQITVTKVISQGSNAPKGMTGWISTEYVQIENGGAGSIVAEDTWDGYGQLLAKYYQAIVEKWDEEKIRSEFNLVESFYFPKTLDTYGFVLQDINADGINELIILSKSYMDEKNEDFNDFITAIYTKVNGIPVQVLQSWTRNRYYICADGSVYNEGSNGAAYSIYYIYKLIDNCFVVQEGVLSGDYLENKETKYGWFWVNERADFTYANYMLISDEDAQERIDYYQSTITRELDQFITFAEYEAIKK